MFPKGTRGYIRSISKRYFLTDRCTITVEQTTQDANGINVTAWVDVYANERCRVIPAGSSDSERAKDFAGQESITLLKRLAVSWDIQLNVGQRVTIAGGEVYYVAALNVDNSDEVFQQAAVVQMRGTDG